MPNFNKSDGFKLNGNPFQKNFPGAFKQEMTEDEIQANIQRGTEAFGSGAGAEVLSKETMDLANHFGLMSKGESGGISFDTDAAELAIRQRQNISGGSPKYVAKRDSEIAQIQKLQKAFQ